MRFYQGLPSRSTIRVALSLLICALIVPAPGRAQRAVDPSHGIVAVGGMLRGLGSVKRVLVIGAHPDDEDTALLTWLERGVGADAAYLALNRGEGGQNLIGPELGVGLGLIRTGELLSARELDGAEQFFTRGYDFGYSKSAEETFRYWPRDELLADVVATVREFRPQIIVSIFSGTPRDGHGQHRVAGIVAREAFEVAGDPERFPEQLEEGLAPWQPTKLYRSTRFDRDATTLRIPTGELDPLYGRSYHQIAMASRSQHRSQDMGRIEELGPTWTRLQLMQPAPATNGGEEAGLFDGVDTTLVGGLSAALSVPPTASLVATIESYTSTLRRARQSFLSWSPDHLSAELSEALRRLDSAIDAISALPAAGHALFLLERERRRLETVLLEAAGVIVESFAADDLLVPGQEVEVEAQIWNGGASPVRVGAVELLTRGGWPVRVVEGPPPVVPPDSLVAVRFKVKVPAAAAPSRVYFLREPLQGALYSWPDDPEVRGRPFGPALVRVRVEVIAAEQRLEREVDVVYRYADQARGEVRRPLHVVPAVGVRLEPTSTIKPLGANGPLSVQVTLRGEAIDGELGTVTLRAPRGWGVSPMQEAFRLPGPGAEQAFEFELAPPPHLEPGRYTLTAEAEARNGRRYVVGYSIIDYPHIRRALTFDTASARVEAFDLEVAERGVGYVPGAGDAVRDAIEAMGLSVDVLDDKLLTSGDLSAYDVVVVGIRAYETNLALVAANDRLLDWVRAGGTLIVQYQQYAFFRGGYAPYELRARFPHDRVADETAAMRVLEPDHPVFNIPNRIGPEDFEGWVQERGLYFPREWDDRYVPLLESADPGEEAKRGALLIGHYGDGVYVYTGLSLFRQLPAGVAGAYRLLANLLSLKGR